MTETSKTVFEKYQVRKTKKQKKAFREYVRGVAEENGWSYGEEKGYLGATNIVIGNPDSAKVIYTAHYDTCARLPFPNFITPKSMLIYILYQCLLVVGMLAIAFAFQAPLFILRDYVMSLPMPEPLLLPLSLFMALVTSAPLLIMMLLLLAGPANKHTANDNTSGVTVLLNLMCTLTAEDREKTALVFFDLEEQGMWGSMKFAANHKNIVKNTLLVNFDCVSDGENILFVLKRGSKDAELLEKSFVSNENVKVEIAVGGAFYPSDQASFKRGVGVASLKRTKKFNILYMNRIHTRKDVIYREENIEFICDGAKKFLENF